MKAWMFGAVAALLAATSAFAGGADEGNAGLDALNSGAYDEAIRHFTLALKPGALTGDDREFAYLNRGKAYAAEGNFARAIADFRAALRLKPDDDDAKAALQDAMAQQGGGGAAGGRAQAPPASSDPWGLLTTLVAQQYYWYQEPGQDPHSAYAKYSWIAPQQSLSLTITTKHGQALVAEFKLEAKTGQLISAALQQGVPLYGTLKATPTSVTQYSFYNGKPLRAVVQRRPDGSVTQVQETYIGGAWGNPTNSSMSPTTLDELTADGLIKAPKKRK